MEDYYRQNEIDSIVQKSFFLTLAGRKKELMRQQGICPFYP